SAVREDELRGPPAGVAFAEDGTPTRAALAFAEKNGVGVQAVERRDAEKGGYLYSRLPRRREPTAALLPGLLAQVVKDLPAPRKMRWGTQETPFLRPIVWLLALLDDQALELEVAGVRSVPPAAATASWPPSRSRSRALRATSPSCRTPGCWPTAPRAARPWPRGWRA